MNIYFLMKNQLISWVGFVIILQQYMFTLNIQFLHNESLLAIF